MEERVMRWIDFGPGKRYLAAGLVAAALAGGAVFVYAQSPGFGQVADGGTTFAGIRPSKRIRLRSHPFQPDWAGGAQIPQHPLEPALRMAYSGMETIRTNIHDYTCILVKRERVSGVLGDYQFMAVKIRNHPFSVYLAFLKPDASPAAK